MAKCPHLCVGKAREATGVSFTVDMGEAQNPFAKANIHSLNDSKTILQKPFREAMLCPRNKASSVGIPAVHRRLTFQKDKNNWG